MIQILQTENKVIPQEKLDKLIEAFNRKINKIWIHNDNGLYQLTMIADNVVLYPQIEAIDELGFKIITFQKAKNHADKLLIDLMYKPYVIQLAEQYANGVLCKDCHELVKDPQYHMQCEACNHFENLSLSHLSTGVK